MPGRFYPVAFEGQAPPEFGLRANIVRVVTIPLDTALDNKRFEIGGNFLWAINGSDLAANIEISFEDTHGDKLPFKKGSAFGGVPFSRLFISAEAQAGKSLTLLIGVDESLQGFRFENAISDFTSVSIAKPDGISTTADTSIAATTTSQVLAANSDRALAIITNLKANSSEIRVGDSNTGAARGIPCQPGETVTLETIAAIYVYNSDAAAQSVALAETSTP